MLYAALFARIHWQAAITSLVNATPFWSMTRIGRIRELGDAPAYPAAEPAARPATLAWASPTPPELWTITCSFWSPLCFAFSSRPGATKVPLPMSPEPEPDELDPDPLSANAAMGASKTKAATRAVAAPRPPRPHRALERCSPPRFPVPQRALFLTSLGG